MVRRKPYTKVEKEGQQRPPHVRGMGDVVCKGFQCLNGDCQEFITVREEEIEPDFEIICPACKLNHEAGGETKFFDYRLIHRQEAKAIEEGEFVVLHDDYIGEAQRFKYCLLCYARKPLEFFDIHSSRQSGRQGECRLCKTIYNGIKNHSPASPINTAKRRSAAASTNGWLVKSGRSTARQSSRNSAADASNAVVICTIRRPDRPRRFRRCGTRAEPPWQLCWPCRISGSCRGETRKLRQASAVRGLVA